MPGPQSDRNWSLLLDNVSASIAVVPAPTLVSEDLSNVVLVANEAAESLFGYGAGGLNGRLFMDLVSPSVDPVEALTLVRDRGSTLSTPKQFVANGGGVFSGLAMVHAHPTLTGFSVWTIIDTAAMPAGRTDTPTDIDPLTGLVRRCGFAAAVAELPADRSWGLLFLDLNDFKAVNDTRGHSYGDDVLAAAARRLEIATDDGDVVARWGGDEFVVMVRNADSLQDISDVARKVRDAFMHPLPVHPMTVMTCSIGAVLVRPNMALDEAIDLADAAMYDVKQRYLSDGELIRLCV